MKISVSTLIRKVIIIIYVAFTFAFVFGMLMSYYDYSYSGYWPDKIVNLIWLLLTVMLVIIFWQTKLARGYLCTLLVLIVLSILPMGIPFLAILYQFTTIGDYQQISLNENYRIERTSQQALSRPRVYIYERYWIFEKNIARPAYLPIVEKTLASQSDSMEINEKRLAIQQAKLIYIDPNYIVIEYQIKGKRKILSHGLNGEEGY